MICEPWTNATNLSECGCPDATPAVITDAIQSASEILYALSGRQYAGLCQETLRPCAGPSTLPRNWPYPWYPTRYNGQWVNIGCGCHIDYSCACGGVPQVDLGRDDVTQIFSVNIDGTTLSAANYRLDEGRVLVRTDGSQWPCCQDLAKDIGETGTWYIELEYGRQPPQAGIAAATKLALELVKGCVGDSTCELPSRVTTVAREGVTFSILDPQDFLTEGRTGLYEVDLFLAAVNPNGLARRAYAWSPGMAKQRRVGVLGS